jgi:hypothetical protein
MPDPLAQPQPRATLLDILTRDPMTPEEERALAWLQAKLDGTDPPPSDAAPREQAAP